MDDCIFCKIVAGKIPARKVAENDEFLAFPDIDPQAPVHLLVIPKKHVTSLKEVTDWGLVGRLHQFAVKAAADKGLGESGYRVLINTGLNGVQTVLHLHLHLLGGRVMGWPPG
jgi:histidine triad (HIT) family protein